MVNPALLSHNSEREIQGHTYGGIEYRWGISVSRFLSNIWLYVANNTRWGHIYYGMVIGKHVLYQHNISDDLG